MSKTEDFCFIIMPFSEDLREVYNAVIKPSVEEVGLKCIRVDETEGSANIVRKIIEYISNARIIIADLTHKNPNVFYELGIAHALNNNTIVIAQDIARDVPFDVKSYKVIEYRDTMGGATRLKTELIQAMRSIDKWSTSPSNPVQDFLPVTIKEKVPKIEHEELKSKLNSATQSLKETQKALSDLELERIELVDLRKQSMELDTLRTLVQRLLKNAIPHGTTQELDAVDAVQNIIDQIESKGEVSVNVQSENTESTTGSTDGKIIFRKVN